MTGRNHPAPLTGVSPANEAFRGADQNRTGVLSLRSKRGIRLWALKARDGDKCFYCGETFEAYHLDHVHPVCRGGRDEINNLVLACGPCNTAKRDWPAWLYIFYAGVGVRLPHLNLLTRFGSYKVPWYEYRPDGSSDWWLSGEWVGQLVDRWHEMQRVGTRSADDAPGGTA